jgi:para-nitrobenzyl esterase
VLLTLPQGVLRGSVQDGVASFKGIPYAPPPFAERRFAPPGPPPNWEGERDATRYGATAPKPPYPVPIDTILPEPVIPGDECLNLNVWTPDRGTGNHPVLVWIHGGAFVNGSGAVTGYDGTAFARDGVVFVTINYRLGVDGFALIDGTVANRGLLDQVAALEWVQHNIEAFGGDPARVTIAGESAGAMSVATLIAMPRARGLFQKAILQSGGASHAIRPDTANKVAAALAARLGVPATATDLANVPIERLVAEQAALSQQISAEPIPDKWGELAVNLMPFEPVIDGEVLPRLPVDAIRAGAGRDIDLLLGSNAEEFALFLVPSGIVDLVNEDALAYSLALHGVDAAKVRAGYGADRSAGELLTAVLSDWFFRIPAIRIAEAQAAQGAAAYMYEFDWRSTLFDGRLGACHALEIPFVFDALDDPGTSWIAGPDRPPQQIADEMHSAWVQFVRDGDPGWPPYLPERCVRRFALPSETVSDPRADERMVWDEVR